LVTGRSTPRCKRTFSRRLAELEGKRWRRAAFCPYTPLSSPIGYHPRGFAFRRRARWSMSLFRLARSQPRDLVLDQQRYPGGRRTSRDAIVFSPAPFREAFASARSQAAPSADNRIADQRSLETLASLNTAANGVPMTWPDFLRRHAQTEQHRSVAVDKELKRTQPRSGSRSGKFAARFSRKWLTPST